MTTSTYCPKSLHCGVPWHPAQHCQVCIYPNIMRAKRQRLAIEFCIFVVAVVIAAMTTVSYAM